MKTTVTIDSDAGTFTQTKGAWSGTFPISELPYWLSFYRKQQQRYPFHAKTYEPDVLALEAAIRRGM